MMPFRSLVILLHACLLTAASPFSFAASARPQEKERETATDSIADSRSAIRWTGFIDLGTQYIDMGLYEADPLGTNPRVLLSGGLDVRIFRVTIPMAAGSGMHFGLDIRPSIGAGGFPFIASAALHGELRLFFEEFYLLGGASMHWPAKSLPDPTVYNHSDTFGGAAFRVQSNGSRNDLFLDAGFGVEVAGSFIELHTRQIRHPRVIARWDFHPSSGWQEAGTREEKRIEITLAVGILF